MVIVAGAATLLAGCAEPAIEQSGPATSRGPTTYAAVAEVLILTNTRRCYSRIDPATAAP